jgi:hypothetical protein
VKRLLNVLGIIILVGISIGIVIYASLPVEVATINKISTDSGGNSKQTQVGSYKKPAATKTPAKAPSVAKKVQKENKPTVIRINKNCELINFKLNKGCYESIDLVGQ